MNTLRLPQVTGPLVLILFALQACTAVPTPTATPAVETPAATPIPLSQLVTLNGISFREEGQAPAYVISAVTPMFAGTEHPHIHAFNKTAHDLIQKEIDFFRDNILTQVPAQRVTSGSSFIAQYELISQRDNIWSFKFNFSGYTDGAALPYRYSLTLNYDLEQGRALAIGELFPEDSDYLKVISRYCIAELSKRNIGFYGGFQQGAEPTLDNYRDWNITAEGLMITFDEVRVAPYAAGPQTVTVPFGVMEALIRPKSPLALYKP